MLVSIAENRALPLPRVEKCAFDVVGTSRLVNISIERGFAVSGSTIAPHAETYDQPRLTQSATHRSTSHKI